MKPRNRHIKIAERVSTRLKLKQLRLLVAIGERSSILRAAEQLNLSQPAATKLLKDLELDFGVQLFERTNRGVIPTEAGSALVHHGKLILAQISQAAQELDDLNEGLGGRVTVGTLLTASAKLLPMTIARIHASRPNVSIVVRDGTNDFLMPLLQTGDLDMVVGRLPEYRHRELFVQEELYREQVAIVCRHGHPLAQAGAVDFQILAEQDWILPPTPTTLRRQVEKEFVDRGFQPPSNAVECVSYLAIRNLLTETDMLAILPVHVIEPEIDRGALAVVVCDLNISSGPVGVSYRSDEALSPAAREFLSELRHVSAHMED
ncbi:MAG: LysR substrate-binding domain-containing protein [Rhizobiaceae bacterium]